jgi:hypothetical protein
MATNSFPRARAVVAGVLFVSWIGYLAYLVSITRNTIPLAGPQIQTADLVILADVTDDQGRASQTVRVDETLFVARPAWNIEKGTKIDVEDLPFCAPKGMLNDKPNPGQGYRGAGRYVIPLKRIEPGPMESGPRFRVKMLPIVPGYYAPMTECEFYYGKDKGAVSKALSQVTGVPAGRIEAMFDEPSLLVPNLPFYFTDPKAFEELDGRIRKAGGRIAIPPEPGETRIYPATPQVLEEVRQLFR